jgi:hypothetical protein
MPARSAAAASIIAGSAVTKDDSGIGCSKPVVDSRRDQLNRWYTSG